jgi:putative ABC transport system permease protein
LFGALGVAAALLGAWWPARMAQTLPPAQTLKGLGTFSGVSARPTLGLVLLAGGAVAAILPPVGGVPLAAYASVALLLLGGMGVLPWLVGALLSLVAPALAHRALPLLAVERARRVRESAAVAVSGVVASLSLAVALTVMVASFRTSVTQWLDTVLPATLYLRAAGSAGAGETVYLEPAFVDAARRISGIERISGQRNVRLPLDPAKPSVTLIARPLNANQGIALPLIEPGLSVPAGQIGIYVSEAMLDLYGARPGSGFAPLQASFRHPALMDKAGSATFFVAGVWRDYARQFGTIAMDQADFVRLTGDLRVNELAIWLAPQTDLEVVQESLLTLAQAQSGLTAAANAKPGALLEFASAQQLRATTLRIFDRSFAVTYWLQGIAIGIGLFGVAASFSAQVLARRKEFGLLAHLGLTRRQVLHVVAGEGAAWTLLGAVAGVALGLAVAVVLVHVVNPQSFHWTMDLTVPWLRLLMLSAAVVLAGTATAWLAGQAAASRDAVLAVKEDW